MKKSFLLIVILAFFYSCSDDDDNNNVETPNTENAIRILQVDAIADQVWLSNSGTEAIDIGDYWLCLGIGTYVQVSDATDGTTTVAPGENIMVNYDVDPLADGLSIFSTNTFGSSDPEILIDYVQWGAANQARVDQAVTAGRWDNASNFLTRGNSYTFTGDANDFGSSFYNTIAGEAIVRIVQVDASLDQVWISNSGTENIDISDYWLCLGTASSYIKVVNENTVLTPTETIMVNYDVNETADGLSLFSTNTFGSSDPEIIVDYVQWGATNQRRVDQAVTAGRWDDADNFLSEGPIYTFNGKASEFGSIFW